MKASLKNLMKMSTLFSCDYSILKFPRDLVGHKHIHSCTLNGPSNLFCLCFIFPSIYSLRSLRLRCKKSKSEIHINYVSLWVCFL